MTANATAAGAGQTPSSTPDSGVDSRFGTTGSGLIGAALSVTAWGAGSVLAKGIDLDPMTIAVYRFGLFSVIILAWMQFRGTTLSLKIMKRSMFGGLALGINVALFFSAVKITNVVNATLIGSLQPVFVGVVAARFFGEQIKKRDALLSIGAFIGVGLVMLASNGTPEWSAKGDALAFCAMLSWATYFIASKQSKGRLTPTEFTAGTSVWACLVNIPLALVFGQDLSWPDRGSLVWLMVMVLVAGVLGHSIMNWSLVRIPLWVGSTFTLLIPVISSLIAWAALGESLKPAQAGAMVLVFGALALIVQGQAKAART